MKFGLSQKRKPKILREGYIQVLKELTNNIRSFECELRRKGRAGIKVDDGDQIVDQINKHTHIHHLKPSVKWSGTD